MVAINGSLPSFQYSPQLWPSAQAPSAQPAIDIQAFLDMFQRGGGALDPDQLSAMRGDGAGFATTQLGELLQLLIDFLANFQQEQQRRMGSMPNQSFASSRQLSPSSWSGRGGGGGGSSGGGGSGGGGGGSGVAPGTSNAPVNLPANTPTGRGSAGDFVRNALAQKGDRYVFGAETNLNDANPNTFDCSELVQWAAAQAGVNVQDGSWNQKAQCKPISVEEAMRTPGALLFKPGHVAISLGDGRTIEAMGSNYGVVVANAAGRFTSGGLIPGMSYG